MMQEIIEVQPIIAGHTGVKLNHLGRVRSRGRAIIHYRAKLACGHMVTKKHKVQRGKKTKCIICEKRGHDE
jgi:hypothetical protein